MINPSSAGEYLQSFSLAEILFLNSLPGIGPSRFGDIVSRFESMFALSESDVFSEWLPKSAQSAWAGYLHKGQACASYQECELLIEQLAQSDIKLIGFNQPDYPPMLREISGFPPVLYVKGALEALHLPQLAIVGSRNTSTSGRQLTSVFARELAASGFVITSGLALGVDSEAHMGALQGNGRTVAVVGTGIDRVYPARHRRLAQDIVEYGGAIVSEFPMGTGPTRQNFPQRNRTISGLSYGTLVVEAALRSGSLITARHAMEQNREVFAIPGSIHNPLSRGCHALIREGASLVESAQDIVDQLSGFLAMQRQQIAMNKAPCVTLELDELEQRVYDVMGYDPLSYDDLAEQTGLPIHEVLAKITSLELQGVVSQMGLGYIRAH